MDECVIATVCPGLCSEAACVLKLQCAGRSTHGGGLACMPSHLHATRSALHKRSAAAGPCLSVLQRAHQMAPKKRASGKAAAKQQAQETVDVLEGLAARLAALGQRKWKASGALRAVPSLTRPCHASVTRADHRQRAAHAWAADPAAAAAAHAAASCPRRRAAVVPLPSPISPPRSPAHVQVKELEAALEKAVAALDNEGVKAHIVANLQQCAAQLHERLRALQAEAQQEQQAQEQQQAQAQQVQQQQQRAKRSRRPTAAELAAAAAEADVTEAEMAEAEEELESLPLLETAAGYRQLAAAAAGGAPDARFTSAALLLSRKLPGPELVLAHVQRLCPVPPPPEAGDEPTAAAQRVQALVAAAGVALAVCSALACEADCPEDALRMFAPAVGQLADAAQLLLQQQERQEQAGEAAASSPAALLREFSQLAGRTLASMHAALRAQQLGLAAGRPAGGSGYWRANPEQPSPAEAADAACSACADLCSLLTTLRLLGDTPGGSQQAKQQREALAAAAAADLRQLAPYGPSGLLDHLASLVSLAGRACVRD